MKKKNSRKKKKQKKTYKIFFLSFCTLAFCAVVYIKIDNIINLFNESIINVTRSLGFVVNDIYIKEKGIAPKNKTQNYISVKRGDPMLAVSVNDLFKDISKNRWIKDLTVHKNLPNTINIFVSYKKAIAIFQENSKFTLIDEDGNLIEEIQQSELNNINRNNEFMPIITGGNSRKNAPEFLAILKKHPAVLSKLNSISYIRERRWDIVVSSGIVVKLPDNDVSDSLNTLELILKQPNINKNTVSVIDMRVKGNVIMSGSKLLPIESVEKNKKSV